MTIEKINNLIKSIKNLPWWTMLILSGWLFIYLFSSQIGTTWDLRFNSEKQVVQNINKSTIVNQVLRQMMEEFKGDRAFVLRFHNGVNYYDGSHKVKSSMDYEVCAIGIEQIGLRMQDLPVSLFAGHMGQIIAGELIGVKSEDLNDPAAIALMKQYGISHEAALPFYNKNNQLIMIIGIDWVNNESVFVRKARLEQYVKKIGNILTDQPSSEITSLRDLNITRGEPKYNAI